VKKKDPNSKELNDLIIAKYKSVLSNYARLMQENDDVTLDELIAEFNRDKTTNFFEFAYSTKMAQIKFRKKMGTYRRYEAVLNKVKAYSSKNLSIRSINYSFIRKYEIYLRNELKNGQDTVSSNLSVLRSIINEAIRHGVYTDRNPFDQIQLKYTENSKNKLTIQELNRLITTPIPDIPSLILAKDFFISCILSAGTRGGDMVTMTKENIVKNCLDYHQQKTGKRMIVPIIPMLMEIFDKHQNDSPYLFPLLLNTKVVDERAINIKLTYINKYLKELCKYCGIFKKITTHCARHTFVDLALEVSHGNIYEVQQNVGHGSVKTTEIYSRNRMNYDKSSLVPGIIHLVNNCSKDVL
jgi:integrase